MANASATKKPNRTREEMRLTPEQARLAEDNTELFRWGDVYLHPGESDVIRASGRSRRP